jgi:hypothetical protein
MLQKSDEIVHKISHHGSWDNYTKQKVLEDFLFLKLLIDNYRSEKPDSRLYSTYCVLCDDLAVLPDASYDDELENAFQYTIKKYIL